MYQGGLWSSERACKYSSVDGECKLLLNLDNS